MEEDDLIRIADYLQKPIGEIRLFYSRPLRGKISLKEYANGDCIFFDGNTRGCTIYPVRPVQCKTWPFWNSNLSDPLAWEETCRVCPGSGQGDLVPLQEIEQRRSQSDV